MLQGVHIFSSRHSLVCHSPTCSAFSNMLLRPCCGCIDEAVGSDIVVSTHHTPCFSQRQNPDFKHKEAPRPQPSSMCALLCDTHHHTKGLFADLDYIPCSYLSELLAHMSERALSGATSDLYHNAPREVRGSPLRRDAAKVSRQHRLVFVHLGGACGDHHLCWSLH